MSSVILVNGEFFMSGVIYNNSALAQCEWMSLKSIVALFRYFASSIISVVSVMARNKPLCFHVMLSGPDRPRFYRNLFKGPPSSSSSSSSSSSYPILVL
jgi:hypothetical protein